MKIAKLILEYISVLIYPTLILTVSLFLRKELRELLGGKLTAKYKNLTFTIEKQKKELEVAEGKTELAVKSIEKAKEVTRLETKKSDADLQIEDYLQNAINLLKINGNEYQIIEILQKTDDKGIHKVDLIKKFTDPRMDMQTFHQCENGIEDAIDSLTKKDIIIMDKGQIQFAHKLFKKI
ncbi:MAG TPA: hypothetical protein PLW77_02640 [Bacteroidales bacterium]|nr:hypothetical protein [Bacteroidales bacterium]HQB22151.1 hypothetical protein [Bacteroidales bacterium]